MTLTFTLCNDDTLEYIIAPSDILFLRAKSVFFDGQLFGMRDIADVNYIVKIETKDGKTHTTYLPTTTLPSTEITKENLFTSGLSRVQLHFAACVLTCRQPGA